MKPLVILGMAAALLSGIAASAGADVVIRMTRKDLKPSTPVSHLGETVFSSDRLLSKWEGDDADGMSHAIFRGDRNLLWIVDNTKKSYMELTEKEMAATGQKVDAAMEKMKAELEKMPPEQRKMVESMMKGNAGMGSGAQPARSVTKTSEAKTINGFPCTKYEVTVDGRKQADVWATPFDKTGLKAADFAVFTRFTEFISTMLESLKLPFGQSPGPMGPGLADIKGVPILTVDYDSEGKPASETSFDSITRGEVPAARYDLPAGYAKKEMFGKAK